MNVNDDLIRCATKELDNKELEASYDPSVSGLVAVKNGRNFYIYFHCLYFSEQPNQLGKNTTSRIPCPNEITNLANAYSWGKTKLFVVFT